MWLILLAFAGAACGGGTTDATQATAGVSGLDLSGFSFEIHQAPGWGCCSGWVGYLQDLGACIDLTEDPRLVEFKAAHGVATGAGSFPTALFEGDVIEGHVPAGAILRLLEQRPDAVGLALPGMSADSPVMGGDPESWEEQPVVVIENDGETVPFEF